MNKKLVVSAILLFAVLAGIGVALTPPPPPPAPVNQSLYIYDTGIAFFQTNGSFTNVTVNGQTACRACHNSTGTTAPGFTNTTLGGVDSRHHGMVQNKVINPFTGGAFQCQDCHPSNTSVFGNGILLDHSCTDCHNSTPFWANVDGARVGNLNRPHHFNTSYDDALDANGQRLGNPVSSRLCAKCHGSVVASYNDSHYVPTYDTTVMITPYAKWKATNVSQPLVSAILTTNGLGLVNVNPPYYASDGDQVTNKEWGGCESCHLGTINTSSFNATGVETNPNSLSAQGLATGKSILPNHDSHHEEILAGNVDINHTNVSLGARTPGATCSWCHVINPGQTAHGGVFLFNLTNPNNLINGVPEVVVDDLEVRNSTIEQADITAGGTSVEFSGPNGTVTLNGTGCEKCHSVASIHNIQFNYSQNGAQGMGHINNNSDCSGCHDAWLPADSWTPGALIPTVVNVDPSVVIAGSATTLTITGSNLQNPDGSYPGVVTVDGVAYTPTSLTESQAVVDIPALTAGTHSLQLVKNGDTASKLTTLIAMSNTVITSAKLNKGGRASTVTINGVGFGSIPTDAPQYYVSFTHAGKQLISTSVVSWSDSAITVQPPTGVVSGDKVTVVTGTATAQANLQ